MTKAPKPGRILSPVANFGRIPVGLLTDPGVTDQECRAYAYLTTWDFRRTGKMFQGREEIAHGLGWSMPKLDRALRALEARGAIRRIRRGQGLTNDIELLAEVVKGDQAESSPMITLESSDRATPNTRENARENEPLAPALRAPEKPPKERTPDPLFEAVCAVTGTNWTELTATGRGPVNKAVADLRALDVKPGQVAVRARKYAMVFPNAKLTPMALAKHWAELGNGATPAHPVRTLEEDRAENARLRAEEATR